LVGSVRVATGRGHTPSVSDEKAVETADSNKEKINSETLH